MKKPYKPQTSSNLCFEKETFEDDKHLKELLMSAEELHEQSKQRISIQFGCEDSENRYKFLIFTQKDFL